MSLAVNCRPYPSLDAESFSSMPNVSSHFVSENNGPLCLTASNRALHHVACSEALLAKALRISSSQKPASNPQRPKKKGKLAGVSKPAPKAKASNRAKASDRKDTAGKVDVDVNIETRRPTRAAKKASRLRSAALVNSDDDSDGENASRPVTRRSKKSRNSKKADLDFNVDDDKFCEAENDEDYEGEDDDDDDD